MIFAVEEYTKHTENTPFGFIGATWYDDLKIAMDKANVIDKKQLVYVVVVYHCPRGKIQSQNLWCNDGSF